MNLADIAPRLARAVELDRRVRAGEHIELILREPGTCVAIRLRCPNASCGRHGVLCYGTAFVLSGFGVRDPEPKRCASCNVGLEVAAFPSFGHTWTEIWPFES